MIEIDQADIPSGYEFHRNKRTDRVYLSKALGMREQPSSGSDEVVDIDGPIRIISKVFEGENHVFAKEGKELVIRVSPTERQEVVAKFYEDSRRIFTLQFQRYTTKNGNPHQVSFSFVGEEINRLFNFIRNIAIIPITGSESRKFDDAYLEEIILSKDQFATLLYRNPEVMEIVNEIQRSDLKFNDVVTLGYRKEQLQKYDQLLHDDEYFEAESMRLGVRGPESVWQKYFEENTWILGYGLNFIFNSPLEGKKLEQVIVGTDVFSHGKRADLFMKTRGIVSSLCFGEIKTHNTRLLKNTTVPYRRESWTVGEELAGGIAQVQRAVHKSIRNIQTKVQITSDEGELTGEEIFLYEPKSVLLIGSLSEFKSEHGTNEEKYSSFEMFRRNIRHPEIITFDELYERAWHIVHNPINAIVAENECCDASA